MTVDMELLAGDGRGSGGPSRQAPGRAGRTSSAHQTQRRAHAAVVDSASPRQKRRSHDPNCRQPHPDPRPPERPNCETRVRYRRTSRQAAFQRGEHLGGARRSGGPGDLASRASSTSVVGVRRTPRLRTSSRWCSASTSTCSTPGTAPATSASTRRVARQGAQNAEENWSRVARSPRLSSYAVPRSTFAPRPSSRSSRRAGRRPARRGRPHPSRPPEHAVRQAPPRPDAGGHGHGRDQHPGTERHDVANPERARRIPVPRLAGCESWCWERAGSAARSAPGSTRPGTTSRWSRGAPTARSCVSGGSPSRLPRSGSRCGSRRTRDPRT